MIAERPRQGNGPRPDIAPRYVFRARFNHQRVEDNLRAGLGSEELRNRLLREVAQGWMARCT